jgi:hypothetical protein
MQNSKLELCTILDMIYSIGLDLRITAFLTNFKNWQERNASNTRMCRRIHDHGVANLIPFLVDLGFDDFDTSVLDSLFDVSLPIGKMLDFDRSGGKMLVPELVDLLHYNYHPLQNAALKLLFRHFRYTPTESHLY